MASNNQRLVSSLRLVIIMLGVMAVSSTQTCHNTYCSGTSSIGTYKRPTAIRFPFQFYNQNPPHLRCGYPGFELSCKQNIIDNDNDLILSLPSGDYLVTSIFYDQQTLLIDDPDYCLPKRLIDRQFNVTGTPFIFNNFESFTFLKCSPTVVPNEQMRVVPCLSDFVEQRTVMAIPTHEFLRLQPISPCSVMSTTMVPTRETFQSSLGNSIELNWYEPDCRYCELRHGTCGFRSSTSQDIACYDISGLKKRVALTGMICLAGVVLLVYGSIQYCRYRKGITLDIDHRESESSSEAPSSQHVVASSNVVMNKGLNGMTIESYPKTLLDTSIEMPKLSDNTCSICLTEYQPRETLRTIPDCNHYFHVSCIDEWLRINATCPLCRNLHNESH